MNCSQALAADSLNGRTSLKGEGKRGPSAAVFRKQAFSAQDVLEIPAPARLDVEIIDSRCLIVWRSCRDLHQVGRSRKQTRAPISNLSIITVALIMDNTAALPRTSGSTNIPDRLPGETLHRYFSLMRDVDDIRGHCVITFDGQVDAARLARAVRLTFEAEPILGCRFVEHPWRPYWERYDHLDRTSRLSIVVSRDPDSDLGHFMSGPLDPAKDPQVKTCLIRSEYDTLSIKINHMVADAGGLLEYARLLAKTYRELGCNPDYVPAPPSRARREQVDVLRQVGLRRIVRGCRHFSLPPAAWDGTALHEQTRGRRFFVRRIGPERLAAVKAVSRIREIPLNHILLASFYRALFEVIDPPMGVPLAAQVTVGLRRYLNGAASGTMSNLVGAFYPRIIRNRNDGFEETLSQVHAAMRTADATEPWIGQIFLAELAFSPPYALVRWIASRTLTTQSPPPFPPIYANLGVIDPEQANFGDTPVADVAMIGPVPNLPARLLTVSTFRNTMTFSTGSCDTAVESERAQRLLDRCLEELPQ